MQSIRNKLELMALTLIMSLSMSPVAQAAATPFGVNRWQKPQVTYVMTGSTHYRDIYVTAIKAWNATGQFRFVPGSAAHHQVTLGTSTATTGRYHLLAGLTLMYEQPNHYFAKAQVLLLTRNLMTYHYTTTSQVHVAEHELGHVIGLQHSRDSRSVMLADNRYNHISQADIAAVKKRYQLPVGEDSTK
ncbi:matrixin family metalloprotease [Lactobacillus sp. CBA3606]|uniref:matrixin family metalloprotease n=1 Tax=Lactobacillus sp. CBA3606 TaxID=2099789 RepID=UPI001F1A9F55|nr:matrixin family metalloprotease [Lactobacillus sp. CBA3606]